MSFDSKYLSVEQCLRKFSGLDKEVQLFDHNYVKPWNAHPDSNRTRPARLLFMKGLQRYPLYDSSNIDEDVDIESVEDSFISPFDNPKTRITAVECERSLKYAPNLFRETVPDDELDINALSSKQRKLYQQVLKVLNSDRLAQLTSSGTLNEPIKRRLAIDKTSREIRRVFGSIFWDMELLAWLHMTLLNHSDTSVLALYIDALQTLKAKIPLLIDRILNTGAGTPVGDAAIQMVKKPWDPVTPILNQNKPKKLPGNPIILLCPSSPNQHVINNQSLRLKFWTNYLGSICKLVTVPALMETGQNPTSAEECLNLMMQAIRNKVSEIKNHYPNRPLILLGWTIGALMACHIALQEPVDGVICVGFPLTGVNGSRGDLTDPLLENKIPTLFIVGQNAHMCSTDDIEDFRSRMRAETALVVVGGADDLLRLCPMKLKLECITQALADRCMLDEITDFLLTVVVKAPSTSGTVQSKPCTPVKEEPPPEPPAPVVEPPKPPEEEGKRRRRRPREYSPEPSPVRKRPRHHVQRQVLPPLKLRISPCSSEASNSGLLALEKPAPVPKSARKSSDKRIGRPTAGTWRKRTPSKPPLIAPLPPAATPPPSSDFAKVLKTMMEEEEVVEPLAKKPETKPFSKNILPKRNDPVDVTAAFGSDSSFLPRPLTPPEPEDTVSAEETERAMAELEDTSPEASPPLPPKTTSPIPTLPAGTSLIPVVTEPPVATSVAKPETKPTITLQPSVTTQPPIVEPAARPVISISLPSPTLTSVFSSAKTGAAAIQSLKTMGGISLLSNPPSTPGMSKSTIITVPSASAATLLVSSPAMRAQPAKMVQLLTKGSGLAGSKGTISVQQVVGGSHKESSCNLSLLSDVAGMTEAMKDTHKKTAAEATLVKLAPEKVSSSPYVKVVKTIHTPPPPPSRIETAEELAEKQLAIQALNKSIGIETNSTAKESGYSICYAKADGSIVSRSVPRFRMEYTYTRMPVTRGRGRGRPPFGTRMPFK